MRSLLTVVVMVVGALLACSRPAPPPATPAVGEIEIKTCLRETDCGPREDCVGHEGCATAWTCQPQRPCTRDAVEYCTCDDRTVTGSSTCPPEPYQHLGPCR